MGAYDWVLGSSSKRALDNGALMISGAYPRKGPKSKQVEDFAYAFGRQVAEREASIVSGNGPTLGPLMVAGIQSIKGNEAYQYTCIIPFKQHGTITDMTHAQKSEYYNQIRTDLITRANMIVFISGEKLGKDSELINSDTVLAEYHQGLDCGRFAIPVATLGGSAALIHERIKNEIEKKLHPYKDLPAGLFNKLADASLPVADVIEAVFNIANWLVENKLSPKADSRRSSISMRDRPHHIRTVSGASIRSQGGSPLGSRAVSFGQSPASAQASRHASHSNTAVTTE